MQHLRFAVVAVAIALIGVVGGDSSVAAPPPAVTGCVVPPVGLISWWRGEGNATDSAGTNNAALRHGAGFSPGKVGQAFRFDGVDDFVQASTTDMPIGNEDRTLHAWINIDAFNPGGESFFGGYGQFGEFTRAYAIGVIPDARVFLSQWGDAIFGPVLRTNRWYHLVATNRSNVATLYVNGAPAISRSLDFTHETVVGQTSTHPLIPSSTSVRFQATNTGV